MRDDYKNTVSFITGASSGIGEAVAREIVARQGKVALVARRLDRLEALVSELGQENALALIGDVTKDGDLEKAAEKTVNHFGKIDITIANAGFGISGKLANITIEEYRKQFETNFFGVLRTIYATLPQLVTHRGRLALVGSVAGHIGVPKTSAYCASKFAVRGLAESIRAELKPKGVSVTLISPGFVASEIRFLDNDGKFNEKMKDPVPPWLNVPAKKAAHELANVVIKRKREGIITGHGKVLWGVDRYLPQVTPIITRYLS